MIRFGLLFVIIITVIVFVFLYKRDKTKNKRHNLLSILNQQKDNSMKQFELMHELDISTHELYVIMSDAQDRELIKTKDDIVTITPFGKKYYNQFIKSKGV